MTRRKLLLTLAGASGLAATVAIMPKPAAAESTGKDKVNLADANVRQLLLLMDADHNGKITKHEWMSFMEAEFNKLDRNGNGELDARELSQSALSARHSDKRS
ncbi:MAG TPA: hypothetical protein VND65_19805 [Candidatus Binatia bacterium]|nr:hypothetical protein [Candidatus Binatia bacterium]